MTDHPQAEVPGLAGMWVDVDIVPLIAFLNSNGCHTVYSCQGIADSPETSGWAYVMFANGMGVELATDRLSRLAFAAGDLDLAVRILGDPCTKLGPDRVTVSAERQWCWQLTVEWNPFVTWLPGKQGAQTAFVSTMRFPPRDLRLITHLVRTSGSTVSI